MLLHCFEDGKVSKRILKVKDIQSSVGVQPNAIKWYHLTSMTVLAKLMAHLSIPVENLNLFGDTTFRNRDKITSDGAIIMSIMSLCLFDGLVCAKKMTLYAKDTTIITLEHKIVSSVSSIAEEDQSSNWSVGKQGSTTSNHMSTTSRANGNGNMFENAGDSMLNIHLVTDLGPRPSRLARPSSLYNTAAVLTDLMQNCLNTSFAEKVITYFIRFSTSNTFNTNDMSPRTHIILRILYI